MSGPRAHGRLRHGAHTPAKDRRAALRRSAPGPSARLLIRGWHLGGAIELVLADAGYCHIDALTADGPDRLIATGRQPDEPSQPSRNQHILAMAARLKPDSPDRARYQPRQATVEPVIGHLKDRIGLRRFARRGLKAAQHELALAATAHNIRRLVLS